MSDRDGVLADFEARVNLTRRELTDWPQTDESKRAGEGSGESKATGQAGASSTCSPRQVRLHRWIGA
jgi:hypothetical protein